MTPQMEKAPLRGTIPEVGVFEKSTKEADVRDASVHAPNTMDTVRMAIDVSCPQKNSIG